MTKAIYTGELLQEVKELNGVSLSSFIRKSGSLLASEPATYLTTEVRREMIKEMSQQGHYSQYFYAHDTLCRMLNVIEQRPTDLLGLEMKTRLASIQTRRIGVKRALNAQTYFFSSTSQIHGRAARDLSLSHCSSIKGML